jgi:hypothetical protein
MNLALAGLTLLGTVLSATLLHIFHKLILWFPVVLQKQQPKSFLSDWQ